MNEMEQFRDELLEWSDVPQRYATGITSGEALAAEEQDFASRILESSARYNWQMIVGITVGIWEQQGIDPTVREVGAQFLRDGMGPNDALEAARRVLS